MELSATAIIGLINLVLIILVALINHLNHVKLTGNDLVHLASDVKEISVETKELKGKVNDLATDVAFMKGRCDTHISKTIRKSKKILKQQ